MKRLLNKQGITLVEIIVVIAIIAILTGILVPALSNTSSFEQEARENARAFYSNVQQAMVQEKLNRTLDDVSEEYMLVYAEVTIPDDTATAYAKVYVAFDNTEDNKVAFDVIATNADGTKKINDTNCICVFEADRTSENQANPANNANPNPDNSEDKTKIALANLSEFGGTINKLLRSSTNGGHYYAVVDSKYRVVSAYYSRKADLTVMNGEFSDDYRVSGATEDYITGAYPFTLFGKGQKVFADPEATT